MVKNHNTASIQCRLCSHQSLKLEYTANRCRVARCPSCELTQVLDKPSTAELEKIYSESYFKSSKYKNNQAIRHENQRRIRLLKTYLGSSGTLLEVGCSNGDFIQHLDASFDVWGVDFSEKAIELAKKKNPSRASQLKATPVENMDFQENFFDALLMWDVLEHLWDPYPILEKSFRFLKPNGYFFLSTPNIGALIAKIMRRYWAFMTPPEHLVFFNRSSLEFLFQKKLHKPLVHWKSQGKWVDFPFLIYKARRVMPHIFSEKLVQWVEQSYLKRLSLYIPTGDIQYCVVKNIQAEV